MKVRGAAFSEVWRQWVHIGFGAGAVLLPYLRWWEAAVIAGVAVIFNVRLLRSFTKGRLHRPNELDQGLPAGLVLYPTSVLLLILLFPSRADIVASAWGILAAGDGAATLVGRRRGSRRWPWNAQKTILGSTAFVLFGGIAGAFLAWWCRPAVIPPPYIAFSLAAPLVAALVAAAVETVPIRLDDNLSVPLTAAAALWALSLVSHDLTMAWLVSLPRSLAIALPLNVVVAWAGYRARTVSQSGAIAGTIIGCVIYVCTGLGGWALLMAAFASAAVTSRMGLKRKLVLGIAEERGGRRGAGNAIANTGIAAGAAMLAVLSYAGPAALVAFTAALVAGASDTIASEIGKAWGRRTWTILPPQAAQPGTSGAVSLEGTAAGLIGAGALAALSVAVGLVPGGALVPIVGATTAAGVLESLLGATFEAPGVLNNDALNLINTATAAFLAVTFAGMTG